MNATDAGTASKLVNVNNNDQINTDSQYAQTGQAIKNNQDVQPSAPPIPQKQKSNRQAVLSAKENPGDRTVESSLRPKFLTNILVRRNLRNG